MKIALINGSPKLKDSASSSLIEELKLLLCNSNNQIISCELHKPEIDEEQKEELYSCDVHIFAFPLYVDGIPSNLLYCLKSLDEYINTKPRKQIKIYSVVNCGFYEGRQNEVAIDILRNWAHKAGLIWGQGIGIGGGGILSSIKTVPIGQGPKKNLGLAFNVLVSNILNGETGDTIYIKPNFPRFLYIAGGNMGWKSVIKSNGLKVKDLFKQV